MKKLYFAIIAALLSSAPALAKSQDWWLVSGAPGAAKIEFIDAASIKRSGNSIKFDVATYWSNGRSLERELKMDCDVKPDDATYSELWNFACGSDEVRMNSGLKLGQNQPEWLAKTVFTMPS